METYDLVQILGGHLSPSGPSPQAGIAALLRARHSSVHDAVSRWSRRTRSRT